MFTLPSNLFMLLSFQTRYRKSPGERLTTKQAAGFSLVELLVAMSITALLLVLTTQILTQTSGAIRLANTQRDIGAQGRTVLDRVAADLSTAMLTGGSTVVFNDETGAANEKGSQIGFMCLSRTRGPSTAPRASIVAYAVRPTTETVVDQSITYGCVHRADAESLFSGGSFSTLALAFTGLPSASHPANSEAAASGIVRFHISFVLDNGQIVQIPPSYTMVSPTSVTSTTFLNGKILAPGRIPIAFFPENAPVAGAMTGRYVKSLVVAVACLEPSVLAKASAAQLEELQTTLGRPGVGETPLAKWQSELKNLTFRPILQSIRFYQRTIPVS